MEDAERGGERGHEDDDKYTKDGTVDLKGRSFLRCKGGRWPASFFILASDALGRMAYYAVASNLVQYLTNVLHQGTVTSANSVNNWAGTAFTASILTAYIADSYLGRYRTIILSSSIYFLGMCLLTATTYFPALRPPPCDYSLSNKEDCKRLTKGFQLALFYCALYIIAIGVSGVNGNIAAIGAEQFDRFEPEEKSQKISFFNWWVFVLSIGNLFATTVLIYIQTAKSWSLSYMISASALAISMLVFIAGTPLYRHKVPSCSPFTEIAQVFVAAARKCKVSLPKDSKDLHELGSEHYSLKKQIKISHTTSLRLLDKSAVKTDKNGKWMLCPVTQVEETKQFIKLLPIFIVTIMPSVVLAQVLTLFIKQGNTLNQRLSPHFSIAPASLTTVHLLSTIIGAAIYDRLLMPFARKHTGNSRGFTSLQRIGIGLAMHVIIMMEASLVERWRLSRVIAENSKVPLTIFILVPQYSLMGVAEVFAAVGKIEFFHDQAPEGMKSLGASFFSASVGIGNFFSSFLLSTVSRITRGFDTNGWIQDNLNASHLDYYYWFLALMNAVNLTAFLIISKSYVYRSDSVNFTAKDDATKESAKSVGF